MEEEKSLFSVSIGPVAKEHLAETAKWARFLAIAGFFFLFLMILVGLYTSITLSRYENMYSGRSAGGMATVLSTTTAITYIVVAVVWFFPLLFLLRFSTAMKTGILSNDQDKVAIAFQNLKVCFRYLGIVTIIGLVLTLLGILLGIASSAVG